jgi:hypothetical protein
LPEKFKYSDQLEKLCDSGCICPPKGSKKQNVVAFRFVRKPCDQSSFIPQGISDPCRVNRQKKEAVKCSLYSLSLHENEDTAKDFYAGLRDNFEDDARLSKLIGTHLAEGSIVHRHGVCTKSAANGHFELHEYEGSSIHLVFNIVDGLLP